MIYLVHRAHRALQADMVWAAGRRGYPEIKYAFNYVFATLDAAGGRASDMAAQAGITRQSMGEIIREMVDLGLLELHPDPEDRRAKLVTYTDRGLALAGEGYQYILEMEEVFAEKFGKEEFEQVRRVLNRLTSYLAERAGEQPADP